MQKPCFNDHGEYREGCVLCRKWRHDPAFAVLHNLPEDGKVKPPKAKAVIPVCEFRGEPTGETKRCLTCSGTMMKVFACSAHPEGCTVGKRVAGHHLCGDG